MSSEPIGFFDRGPFHISARALGAFIAAYMFGQFILSGFLYFEPFSISVFFMGIGNLALVLIAAHFLLRENGISRTSLGWVPVAFPWFGLALLGALVAHLFAALFWIGVSPEGIQQIAEYNAELAPTGGRLEPLFSFMAICLIYPILEEILFRGALQTYLSQRFGLILGIGGSALIFGLAHSSAIASLSLISDQVLAVLSLAAVGVVASLLRHFSGSLYPAILMHGGYNAVVFLYAAALP